MTLPWHFQKSACLLALLLASLPAPASASEPLRSIDPSFHPPTNFIWSVPTLLQPDQKILALSDPGPEDTRRKIFRLNPDGSNDPTFTPPSNILILNFSLAHDGKILLFGRFTNSVREDGDQLLRLLPNGSLDAAFSVQTDSPDIGASMAELPNGQIFLAGYFRKINGVEQSALARINSDGTLDRTFLLKTNAINARPILPQNDGSIVFNASFCGGDVCWGSFLRALPDGSIDPTFQNIPYAFMESLTADSHGRILVGGTFTDPRAQTQLLRLTRLLPDGTKDPEFHDLSGSDSFTKLVLQPDEKILVAGLYDTNSGRYKIVRFNSDGSPDGDFIPALLPPGHLPTSLALQLDGKLLVSGPILNQEQPQAMQGFILRYNSDSNAALDPLQAEVVGTHLVIHWPAAASSTLQTSDNMTSWADLINASQPYLEPLDQARTRHFFRVRFR